MKKIPVGILGATGVVGQRFLLQLHAHPWFEPVWLAASDRSTGKLYREAAAWRLAEPLPERMSTQELRPPRPGDCPARVIFSALDAAIAAELEPAFAAAGHMVISNSSALRMHPAVPLLIPEINPDHLELLTRQKQLEWGRRGGGIVTNPNCSTAGLALALAPLERAFGLRKVMVTTMQAVSGAGYPGVASLDILGNVVPYIGGEEDKIEREPQKILGRLEADGVAAADFQISAACNRVPVEDGHLESVSLDLRRPASREEILAAWQSFHGRPQELRLPAAPAQVVEYLEAADRPQPRLDRNRNAGMSTLIGRLRPCPVLGWKFTLLSHNTLRGAAGAALLNAELMREMGYLER